MIRWISFLVYMIWVRVAYFVELDYVGVPQDLQDADLPSHPLDVCLLHYLLLLQGFHRHSLVSGQMDSQTHFAEGALSDAFAWICGMIPILYCPRTNSPADVLIYIQSNSYITTTQHQPPPAPSLAAGCN